MTRLPTLLAAVALAAPAAAQPADLPARLEALAARGHAEAAYHLGMLYNNGIGVTRDNRRAFALFRTAAAGGDPLAAYKVGCYFADQFPGVVPPDEAQALRYKRIAAEAGYALAQADVANILARRGDHAGAVPWWEAASRQGEPRALYNLSSAYLQGNGVARSPARAHAFFRLAHLHGRGSISAAAQRSLDEMAAAMSPAERVEADRIAETWVTGPTALTRLAREGQQRAEAIARGV
jgi:TPR repeat protein